MAKSGATKVHASTTNAANAAMPLGQVGVARKKTATTTEYT